MSEPRTNAALFRLIEQSRLIDAEQIDHIAASFADKPDNPRAVGLILFQQGLLTKFQLEQILAGRWDGFWIGKYKITGMSHGSSLARFFHAIHTDTKREAWIVDVTGNNFGPPWLDKKFKPEVVAMERWKRDARRCAAIRHPNFRQAFLIDRDGDRDFLAIEEIEDRNLSEIVEKDGPLPWPLAVRVICQIASALEQLRGAGLTHREVIARYVIIDDAGSAVLLNCGSTTADEVTPEPTHWMHCTSWYTGMAIRGSLLFDITCSLFTGMPHTDCIDYLAPELVLDAGRADIRSDIYALGCLFYFLLSGRLPFPDGSVASKFHDHLSRPPRPIRELTPDVPMALADHLHRLLAKLPAERFSTPADVVQALKPFIDRDRWNWDDPLDSKKPESSMDE